MRANNPEITVEEIYETCEQHLADSYDGQGHFVIHEETVDFFGENDEHLSNLTIDELLYD